MRRGRRRIAQCAQPLHRCSAPAALLAAVVLALAVAPAARAHPLGNFSINHLAQVSVSADRVEVHWILDQAEIPTFQERGVPQATVLARKRAEAARGLRLVVDGRPVALRMGPGGLIALRPGAGGLPTTRVELDLSARVRDPRSILLHDETFPGRVGWRAIVARPGRDTAVRSSVPAGDPTRALTAYPKALLSSPADVRSATLRVRPGHGELAAPRAPGADLATTRDRGAGDGLAGVLDQAAAGRGVLLFLVLAAFGWGAVHALSPGHGKAMVAAYLVGTRGTARHAAVLGLIVTATHTAGVFALGLVTLALSQYVLPEDLYPWLNLASGLLVVCVGAAVLRSRARRARDDHHHAHDHHHDHPHGHGDHHAHGHAAHHHGESRITTRGLLAMGMSAGLIPCPSALVVLLGAIAQHQVVLGLGLIVAFSAGLAATLTALGIAVVHVSRLTTRIAGGGRVVAVLPAASALVIVAAGCALTVQALPKVM